MKVYLINSDPDSGPSAIYLTREEADKHAETVAHCLVDEHIIDTLPPEARMGLHLYQVDTVLAPDTPLAHWYTQQARENEPAAVEEITNASWLPRRAFRVSLWATDEKTANEQAFQQIKEKFGL